MTDEWEVPQEKSKGDIPADLIRTRLYVVNPWFLLAIFALAYIAFDFFSLAGQDFLLTHLGENSLSWKGYLMVSGALLGVLYFITQWAKIPLVDFEQI